MPSAPAKPLTISRDDLVRLEKSAWQLYGDIATASASTTADRHRAFDAAMHAFTVLLDHDTRTFRTARDDYDRRR